jgi:hypothetical protein
VYSLCRAAPVPDPKGTHSINQNKHFPGEELVFLAVNKERVGSAVSQSVAVFPFVIGIAMQQFGSLQTSADAE